MDRFDSALATLIARRRLLGALGTAALAAPVLAETLADLRLPGGNGQRPLADEFPGKSGMILQRARPALLETPLSVLGRDAITPNAQFFVRWHWQDIPTAVDVASFRLKIFGHVARPIAVPLAALLRMPRIELVAVNQCSGNSRGFFSPRVPGAQWGHGAVGNARWVGVSLKHLLDLAGVKPGAVQVRFGGLDRPAPGGPDFVKALDLDHARDGEVMVAFQMNGEQLPLLNGFPLRLVVPGWFSTYWIKALDRIEVLPRADDQYWMAKAYRIPTTPGANVAPGAKDFPTVPINRMAPRSWITSIADGETVGWTPTIPFAGVAMGGDHGVARVEVSADGGRSWGTARLGPDLGRYSFRTWEAERPLPRGRAVLMARCTSTAGVTQPMTPNWNPGGYLRCCVEPVTVTVA
jgi:DMSO/TMAO reductase YedYZ molybdopterin-dependent catalytic subunit